MCLSCAGFLDAFVLMLLFNRVIFYFFKLKLGVIFKMCSSHPVHYTLFLQAACELSSTSLPSEEQMGLS